jgi:predicted metalloprotease with PDZ domain
VKVAGFGPRWLAALGLMLGLAQAEDVPTPMDVPTPLDKPYPGVIELQVDATNLDQKIFQVRELIPVGSGQVTLLYPQWHLGTHAPADRMLAQFAGLIVSGNHRRLEWIRDPVNPYAFHVDVPAGVSVLQAEFQFLSPVTGNQGAILMTPEMLAVHWESVVLYPAGYYARGIMVKASVTLPQNWPFAGALEAAGRSGAAVNFKAVNLEELIDSPLYAGRHFRRIDLDPGATVPVFLDMFADSDADLQATPQQIDAHRAVVQQAYKLFGSHHYDHYDMLLALSDEFSFAGLEHHQSGENGVRTTYFSDWDKQQEWRSNLVSHEYIHSWDGKYRRPADQLTANFNLPMQDSLLWVYEGGTSYWGHVVGARSGLVDAAQMRDGLAATAALYDTRAGRAWRSLQDTTNDPIVNRRGPLAWTTWQRAEDYYSEGELIWLDADTKIREMSGEKRSLDDFAREFFGVQNGRHVPLTYTFADVVAALNRVLPYDWAGFLRARLDGHGPGAPLDGVTRAGWKLVYAETETAFFKDAEEYRKAANFAYSLGLSIAADGRIASVAWDSPAFKAGLTEGYTLLAVGGRAYKPEVLKAAITAAKNGRDPIELLLRINDRFRTVRIDYHGGLKYPRLERIEGTPDRLAAIFAPL